MAFDPSVISTIGEQPDIGASMEKAFTLKDMMNENSLKQMKIREGEQNERDNATTREVLKKYDLTKSDQASKAAVELQGKGLATQGLNAIKANREYESGKYAAQLDQLKVLSGVMDFQSSLIAPVYAQAQDMLSKGATPVEVDAYIAGQLPKYIQDIQGNDSIPPEMKQAIIGHIGQQGGKISYAQLQQIMRDSEKGRAIIKSQMEQANVSSEITRRGQEHQEAEERLGIARQNAATFGPEDGELLGALAEKNISLPAGLRSKQQIKATLDGLRARNPGQTADQIADGIKSGKLALTAETAGARVAGTQIGKVALAANELDTFGDQVLDAVKQSDLSKVPVGMTLRGLLQMGEKQASNAGLLNLRLKLQALNNAYDQLSARGGTDKDKREHIHSLFDVRLSADGINTLVTAVKQEAVGARAAADRTVGQVSSPAIPGMGGGSSAPPSQGAPAAPQTPVNQSDPLGFRQ